jgi:hypothetical protein
MLPLFLYFMDADTSRLVQVLVGVSYCRISCTVWGRRSTEIDFLFTPVIGLHGTYWFRKTLLLPDYRVNFMSDLPTSPTEQIYVHVYM